MISCGPGNIQTCPLLGDCPFRPKKTSSVEVLILFEKIVVGDPEELVPAALVLVTDASE
jgi:hypothetical protein